MAPARTMARERWGDPARAGQWMEESMKPVYVLVLVRKRRKRMRCVCWCGWVLVLVLLSEAVVPLLPAKKRVGKRAERGVGYMGTC